MANLTNAFPNKIAGNLSLTQAMKCPCAMTARTAKKTAVKRGRITHFTSMQVDYDYHCYYHYCHHYCCAFKTLVTCYVMLLFTSCLLLLLFCSLRCQSFRRWASLCRLSHRRLRTVSSRRTPGRAGRQRKRSGLAASSPHDLWQPRAERVAGRCLG